MYNKLFNVHLLTQFNYGSRYVGGGRVFIVLILLVTALITSVGINIYKVVPDWICLVTSQFTKLFYCERANIAHIQSGDLV